MLLNIKVVNSTKDLLKYFPIGSLFGCILFFELLINFVFRFQKNTYNTNFIFDNTNFYFNWFENIEICFNVEVFGLVLYSYFFIHLLIVGFILLLAILGTVVLTFDKDTVEQKERNQFVFKQVVRTV